MLGRLKDRAFEMVWGMPTPAQLAARTYEKMTQERRFLLETLPRLQRNNWEQARCAFALSTGRAGSMQLAALLNLSPRILGLHEPSPMLLHLAAQAYSESSAGLHWQYLAHGMRDELIAYANHLGKIYIETNNRLTFVSRALAVAFPNSKFIHLHRDPLEVIQSGLRRRWYAGSAVEFSLIGPTRDDEYSDVWDSMSQAEKIAWFWVRVNQTIEKIHDTLPNNRFFRLRASDMFRCDMRVIGELFEFLEAPAPDESRVQRILGRRLNASRKRPSDDIQLDAVSVNKVCRIVGQQAAAMGYRLPDGCG